jgi:hypothetical protein
MPPSIERLRQKLSEAGIPEELHQKFVDFQSKHAGKQDAFGRNPVVWGILLDTVHDRAASAMIPGEVGAEEENGIWHVICADVHMSDTMTIDQHGRLYWSFQPCYSDFDLYFLGQEPDLGQSEQ